MAWPIRPRAPRIPIEIISRLFAFHRFMGEPSLRRKRHGGGTVGGGAAFVRRSSFEERQKWPNVKKK
jgi:hypothetical protein